MRHAVVVTAVACLAAGCALTPAELVEKGERYTFTSKQAPMQAARCMGRIAEERSSLGTPLFRASWREGATPGSAELLVHLQAAEGTALYALLEPTAEGANITAWRHEYAHALHYLIEDMKGC